MNPSADSTTENEPYVLYVNTRFNNEATLDDSMEADASGFGRITWREFLESVRNEPLEGANNLNEWLEENYSITANELDEDLSSSAIDRYYTDLAYHQDNHTGGNARAFKLLRSLEILPMDKDGNGAKNGIEMIQTTANGPRKFVYVADKDAADWLVEECKCRGVRLSVQFI